MSPEEEIAYLQEQRDQVVKDLEIAREAEARQQATAKPDSHESPELLEAKTAQIDELIKEAQARQTEQAREAVEIQGRLADAQYDLTLQLAKIETAKTVVDVLPQQTPFANDKTIAEVCQPISTHHWEVQESLSATPEIALVGCAVVVQKVMDKLADMSDSFKTIVEGTGIKEVVIPSTDKIMAVILPDQTKEIQNMAERHVEAQDKLERDLEALKEKFISDHADASAEQRAAQQAALEEQARAAHEALARQQAAELQRMTERQQTPPVRF
jgi:hypothetical protein